MEPDHARATSLHALSIAGIIGTMSWTTPVYEELKMDAEIGSYQEDGEWPPIVERSLERVDAAADAE